MKTIKGPAIFLAQFLGDDAPFEGYKQMITDTVGQVVREN